MGGPHWGGTEGGGHGDRLFFISFKLLYTGKFNGLGLGIDGTDGGRELVGGVQVQVPVGSPLVGGSNWDRWVAMFYRRWWCW
jgi:hypothetical protein